MEKIQQTQLDAYMALEKLKESKDVSEIPRVLIGTIDPVDAINMIATHIGWKKILELISEIVARQATDATKRVDFSYEETNIPVPEVPTRRKVSAGNAVPDPSKFRKGSAGDVADPKYRRKGSADKNDGSKTDELLTSPTSGKKNCRNGSSCTRDDCMFNHKCDYGDICTRINCNLCHGDELTLGEMSKLSSEMAQSSRRRSKESKKSVHKGKK